MTMGYGGIFGNPYGAGGYGGGIFGAPRKRFGIDALKQSRTPAPPLMGAERMPPPAAPVAQQAAPQRWMDGGKFKARDALGLALGAIGDAFTGRPNTANMILGNQQQRRDLELQRELFAQQRAAGLEDYRARKLVDQEFAQPEGPDIGLFEDNAGNRFRYDKRTGIPIDQTPVFVDPNERVYFNGDAMVRVPNTFRQGGGMPSVRSREDYDALPPGAQYTDPNGNIRTKGGAASNSGGNFRP